MHFCLILHAQRIEKVAQVLQCLMAGFHIPCGVGCSPLALWQELTAEVYCFNNHILFVYA